MKFTTMALRLTAAAAGIAAVFSSAAGAAQAATPPVIVALTAQPTNCGPYNAVTNAQTDLAATVSGATGGQILVCPGVYNLSGPVTINGATGLSVRRALLGPGNRPVLQIAAAQTYGIQVNNSTGVFIDGLILDGTANDGGQAGFIGFDYENSSGGVRNNTVVGTGGAGGIGVKVDATLSASTKPLPVLVTASYIVGAGAAGIQATGPAKLTIAADVIDGTDGGRVTLDAGSAGVKLDGSGSAATPTGTVLKSTISNVETGVLLNQVSSVTVGSNTISAVSANGVAITTDGSHRADKNKITGNTISGIGAHGLTITDTDSAEPGSLGTLISKNVFQTAQYQYNGSTYEGVVFDITFNTHLPLNTAKVDHNFFMGFPVTPNTLDIVNVSGHAQLNLTGNDKNP